ncbi:IS66 family insertion sequence element accessory protein TnpB [Cesiribacter sp. SM1]|uniref:IS66 family insertion sequence element accessory protein TnpA n=1 Tax=Cesiribacter sp. SM1 TaxID=2861196 RepID=UPI001CD4EFC8|nr:IS66 family insertion sequence element accessory protein TnpB [Cesiribacter sp. SM1]
MNIEEKMFELVEDCLRSGKTQKEYSQQAGIGYAKFNYWACKYRKQQQPVTTAGFIKVDALPVSEELEICYPNGVRLNATGADLSLISQLIRLY